MTMMRESDDLLVNVPLNWPEAREWMWNYCVYLGGYEENGIKYDLGVYMGAKWGVSAAIVYGPNDGDYLSGPLNPGTGGDLYKEVNKRMKVLGLCP